jgi:hypothetical protein
MSSPQRWKFFDVRTDKPITRVRTPITNQTETIVLDGNALVWTEPL